MSGKKSHIRQHLLLLYLRLKWIVALNAKAFQQEVISHSRLSQVYTKVLDFMTAFSFIHLKLTSETQMWSHLSKLPSE